MQVGILIFRNRMSSPNPRAARSLPTKIDSIWLPASVPLWIFVIYIYLNICETISRWSVDKKPDFDFFLFHSTRTKRMFVVGRLPDSTT